MLVGLLGLPIIITLAGYAPFATRISDRVKPYLVWPSTIGTYQVRPLPFLLGNAPTLGQSLFIGVVFIVNLVLMAIKYKIIDGHMWYGTKWQLSMAVLCWRTGDFAFTLLPLVIAFAGRNNPLLWLTNWSHSTYLLLHRWVARFYAAHVILHSIFGLALYVENGTYCCQSLPPRPALTRSKAALRQRDLDHGGYGDA